MLFFILLSSAKSLSRVQLFATPWTAAHQVSLSIINSQSLFKLMSIELMMDKYTGKAFVVVQLLSHVQLFMTPWTAACQASVFLHYLPEFAQMSIESVMLSNHLIICCHLLLSPSIFPSIRVFSNELALWIRTGASASVSVLPINIQD